MAGAAIALDVGKGFVSDAAQSLLGRITNLIEREISLAWGFKDDLRGFQQQFETMQGMLAVSTETSSNPVLEIWLNKVKNLVLEAEDVLDDYAYLMLKRKIISNHCQQQQQQRPRQKGFRLKTKLRIRLRLFFSRSLNPVVLRLGMAHKVKSLKDALADIFAEADKLGIKPVKVAAHVDVTHTSHRPSFEDSSLRSRREHVDCEGIIGRDKDRVEIIRLLCHPTHHSTRLSVVGIYGMAGLGKTTICRDVFQTSEVKERFHCRIWVCVSHDFELKELLKNMADQVLENEASTIFSLEIMKRKMKEKLEGKQYLLVLDDVWDTFIKAWEPLRSSLQEIGGSEGTTLLVTSRSKDVLEKLRTHKSDGTGGMEYPCIHELGKLKKEESWDLFWQRVGHEGLSNSVKKEVRESLLKRCDGVPLAIRILGDLLQSKKEAKEWEIIEQSEIWNEQDDILPSVKLSFKYLSSVALKRCFSFCGIFREDEYMRKDNLIQLWIANGLLQSFDDGVDKMERVGGEYFDELLSNSLFQDAKFHVVTGKLEACKMHDVVHKLAREILKQESSGKSSSVETENHLSVNVNDVQRLSRVQDSNNNKLRTLLLFGECERLDEKVTLSKFKCLRALSLVGLGLKELPDSIRMLKHLRYLDISYNDLECLPDWLTELHHLQTLRNANLVGCQRLPREISKLVNLRHLCAIERMGIPEGLGMLTCLQTLPRGTNMSMDWGGRLSELRNLNQLKGRLRLLNLQKVTNEEAREARLGSKEKIDGLKLDWDDDSNADESSREEDKGVLDALQPHPNLSVLMIFGYKAKALPQWVMEMKGSDSRSLSNLVHLNIDHCNYITCVPNITPLTRLETLRIAMCPNVTTLVPMASLFNLPKLQMLSLGPFSPELDTIFPPLPPNLDPTTSIAALPISMSLHKLDIDGKGMYKVKSLPPQIQYLLALTELNIWYFPCLEVIPEWLSNLTSLTKLCLVNMPMLKHLPSPSAMQQLEIHGCRLLRDECA